VSLPPISVAEPLLDGNELEYVTQAMKSGWISSRGEFIERFERAFADFCGVRHAVATNNGTTALHLALAALGLGPGDEVLVPSLTYIATANCVAYCGASPVLADSEPRTMNLDPADLERRITDKTRAVIPVHLYGHPADMDAIHEVADRHGLLVVEDAAEALGARYKGARVGGLSDAAIFSFFGNKIITTGEGGMVTTNDDTLAERLRLLRSQGMDPKRRYWFPVVGFNYRMTNLQAAIGLAQLERVDHHLAQRRRVAAGYQQRLAGLSGRLTLPVSENWAEHVWWMYTVLTPPQVDRDRLMAAMAEEGIETRPVFHPMHHLPPYAHLAAQGPYPQAENLGRRGLNLPTHAGLTDADLDRVVAALERALG
jgi:perosamine synthetase